MCLIGRCIMHTLQLHCVDIPCPACPCLQLRQAESRVQSLELREKRRAYLAAERERKEAQAARR